jgi:hypothetical protein
VGFTQTAGVPVPACRAQAAASANGVDISLPRSVAWEHTVAWECAPGAAAASSSRHAAHGIGRRIPCLFGRRKDPGVPLGGFLVHTQRRDQGADGRDIVSQSEIKARTGVQSCFVTGHSVLPQRSSVAWCGSAASSAFGLHGCLAMGGFHAIGRWMRRSTARTGRNVARFAVLRAPGRVPKRCAEMCGTVAESG